MCALEPFSEIRPHIGVEYILEFRIPSQPVIILLVTLCLASDLQISLN